MDGWCSVADLTRWGFAHAQVVDDWHGVDAVVVSDGNELT